MIAAIKLSAAFFASSLVLAAGIGLILYIGKRRPPGTPYTWGEAMVGATFVFGLMLLGYGIVPNEWLRWADDTLLWRSDRILLAVSTAGVKFGQKASAIGGSGRILVSYQALRDIIAAGIYVVMLGLQIVLWSVWQKRGQKASTEVDTTSAYGRPLVRKA